MKQNKIMILLISILLLFTSVQIVTSNKLIYNNSAEKPTWTLGNYWKYDMDFIFTSKNNNGKTTLKVDADISDMYATVTDITKSDGEDVYKLNLDGNIAGEVSLFGQFDFAALRGNYGGDALISVDNLGIKKFDFYVDGEVDIPVLGWRELQFNMIMDFLPCFDFFEFPISQGEPDWKVLIENATIQADVYIDVVGGYTDEFVDWMEDFEDNMTLLRTETITNPDMGNIDTYVIGGDWGKNSELWYGPDVGYLAQVEETLIWKNGKIESEFNLYLKETNYDVSNHPPEKPNAPDGPNSGEANIEYSYNAVTTDEDNDQLYYMFDWGDGTYTDWLGPYNSGEECQSSHSWTAKGVYNVLVKARDVNQLESEWSNSLSVLITGKPNIDIFIDKIQGKDEIDVGSEAEWYYQVSVKPEVGKVESETYHNTDNGKYNGEWTASNTWSPKKTHRLLANTRYVVIKLKLMDYDSATELGKDDLADVSGCNIPDNDGVDNEVPDKRGAVYHGTYDLVTNELKQFSPEPNEFADKIDDTTSPGLYITSGDFTPDSSTEHEGGVIPDPQNDAMMFFSLTNDYQSPQAIAKIVNEQDVIRPEDTIELQGSVLGGTPDYSWHWDFGDQTTSTQQNPSHSYSDDGTYTITLTLTDGFDQISTDTIVVEVGANHKPTNLIINGPNSGKAETSYEYKFKASDSDGDQLYYRIDWGDGSADTGWLGPYDSDSELPKRHTWTEKKSYTITFDVKDTYDATESKTLDIQMPKTYDLNDLILKIIKDRFPLIYHFLLF